MAHVDTPCLYLIRYTDVYVVICTLFGTAYTHKRVHCILTAGRSCARVVHVAVTVATENTLENSSSHCNNESERSDLPRTVAT